MNGEINWGPEIRVDGMRPEWLVDGEDVKCFTTVWHSAFLIPHQIDWPIIRKIKLRADHSHYAAQEPPTAPNGGEVGPEVVERLSEALTWIADFAASKRNGTDDWFDLVEIEQVARKALLPEPVDGDLVEARRCAADWCGGMEDIIISGADDKSGYVTVALAAIKRGRALEKEAGR